MPDSDIRHALLAHIRSRLGGERASIPDPLRQLTGSFDTTIYEFVLRQPPNGWPAQLILRLFPPGSPSQRASSEFAAHQAIGSQGFPCPAVYVSGDDLFLPPGSESGLADGQAPPSPYLIKDRFPGVPILDAALGPSTLLFRAPTILANLLADLHELDPAPFETAMDATLARPAARLHSLAGRLSDAPNPTPSRAALSDVAAWLVEHLPTDQEREVICHGDFHPLNVLWDGSAPSLIDWADTTIAPPEYDLAIAHLIMTVCPVEQFGPVRLLLNAIWGLAARRLIAVYGARRPLDAALVDYYRVQRAFQALARIAIGAPEGYAWTSRRSQKALRRIIRDVTGIAVP